jgi:feruloyl esterase
VDGFMRLYVTPGADHMGMGAPPGVDILQVLVDWAEKDRAPGELVQVAQDPQPPFAVKGERPMCRYPAFPRYVGGNARMAESFRCSAE